MIPLTRDLGALVRWLLKGCRTNLGDEIHGRLEPTTFLKDYDLENYLIGLITAIVIIGLAAWIFFG